LAIPTEVANTGDAQNYNGLNYVFKKPLMDSLRLDINLLPYVYA